MQQTGCRLLFQFCKPCRNNLNTAQNPYQVYYLIKLIGLWSYSFSIWLSGHKFFFSYSLSLYSLFWDKSIFSICFKRDNSWYHCAYVIMGKRLAIGKDVTMVLHSSTQNHFLLGRNSCVLLVQLEECHTNKWEGMQTTKQQQSVSFLEMAADHMKS